MKLYLKTVKLFCKTTTVIIPYILMLAVDNIILYRLLKAFAESNGTGENAFATPLFFMKDVSYTCFLTFIFFLFLSYEFMRKIREASLEESLFVAGIRGRGVYGLQLLVLWTAALVQMLNVSVYLIMASRVLDMSLQYVPEMISFVLVDFLLLALASVGMGVVLSWLKRRFLAYGVIICLIFLTLPNTEDILLDWQMKLHIPIFVLRDFICLLQPDSSAFPDPLYGLPLEWYRQAAMLFWVILSILLCSQKILYASKRVRMAVSIILAGCMVVMGYGVLDKGSVLLMTDHPESSLADVMQYHMDNPAREEEVSFSVTSYDMDLSMDREMTAEVTLSISQDKALTEYPFTLYHSYEIEKITDSEGNELPFRRKDDYIWVENVPKDNTDLSPIETLHFSYRGHSPTFYSNRKACFLPDIFPYYPRAGCQAVYGDYGFVNADNTAASYRIRVSGIHSPLFSNLKENNGVLCGTADHVLLVAGYCKSADLDGTTCLYYPFQKSCMENVEYMLSQELEEKMTQLYQFLDIAGSPEANKKMLVAIPDSLSFNSVMDVYYDCGDYILFNGPIDPYEILKTQTKAEDKKDMKMIFFSVMPDPDMDLSEITLYQDTESDYYDDYMELNDTFIQKMKELGVQYVAQKTYHYLIDPEDQTDALDFLKHLQ